MSSSIRKRSSFRLSTGSMKSSRKKRVRRSVSFTRDVFLVSAIRDETLDEINRVLLEMAADQELDLNAVLVGGRSALHQAVLANRDEAVAMFLDKGAYVDVLDDNGWTPLHYAVDAGQCDTANLLVSRGADPRHPTLDGNNYLPMDIAMDQCDSDMMALLTDGINQMQQRPIPVIAVTTTGSKSRLQPRRASICAGVDYDGEISADNMDTESVNSDCDNRSIASINSQLFVPSLKRSEAVNGPLHSLRKFRDRVRRPSPSPVPMRDSDGNTSEDTSFCTINEFITDLFTGALQGAESCSLMSVVADDSQGSLASFPNSSDSPQDLFLAGELMDTLHTVRINSSAEDSKTSSSSITSDDSASRIRRMSSTRSLQSAGHYNSNGSLVSCDQLAHVASSASARSSGIHVCSSGSLNTCHSTPRHIPTALPIRTYGFSSDDGQCVSPTYDVPRSGVRRKVQPRMGRMDLRSAQLGTSFDYDVPHSALKHPHPPSALLQRLSTSDEGDENCQLCLEDSGTFVTASDLSDRGHVSRESTLLGEDSPEGEVEGGEHCQVTPQASVTCDTPPPALPAWVLDVLPADESPEPDQFSHANVDPVHGEHPYQERDTTSPVTADANQSANTLDASDSTLGVSSSTSVSRYSPEFELTPESKIKDMFTSVQSLPNFRHPSGDQSTGSSMQPRSPSTPDSTDSDDYHHRHGDTSHTSSTLPWRGRHGSKRPHLHSMMPSCAEAPEDPCSPDNRLSVAEFLLSLSPSGSPAAVREENEQEEEEGDGEHVMSLLDFLSNDAPKPRPAVQGATDGEPCKDLTVQDMLLAPESPLPEETGQAVSVRTRVAEDPSRAPRPVSYASDWMAPVESHNLPSHVATLPRGFSTADSEFKRQAANRGSFRRLINKATRSTKKSNTSLDSPTTSSGTLGSLQRRRNSSTGSGETPTTGDGAKLDEQTSQSKKTFLQRTASLRSSFRSKKSRKQKSGVGGEEEQPAELAATSRPVVDGAGIRQRYLARNQARDQEIVEEQQQQSQRSNRSSAILTVAMTAL